MATGSRATLRGPGPDFGAGLAGCAGWAGLKSWAGAHATGKATKKTNMNNFKELNLPLGFIKEEKNPHFKWFRL
jgi:hypothetical protein